MPDAPTAGQIDPSLGITLWNGLFVHKDTPADVRAKIEAVAKKTIASDKAKEFAKKTGAQIYWKDAAASTKQIEADGEAFTKLNQMLE